MSLPRAGIGVWLRLLTRQFARFRVTGNSMLPTLRDGEVVVVDPHGLPTPGGVVMCRHPFRTDVLVIKRLGELTHDGALVLMGDHPDESTDSRSYGPVPRVHFRGVIVATLG
jgi:nickel-type superoxide dismutase maturation protease